MWFMYILSWLALAIQTSFVTLSIAAGLYYLAELVEEYTVITAKVIKYMIFLTIGVFLGLLVFEDLPLSMIITGLAANISYFIQLRNFPYFAVTAPPFIIAVGLLLLNHYLAFSYFATVWHPFSEVLAYFTICLWLVPFALFVSLSANEYVLPTTTETRPLQESDGTDVVSHYFNRRGKKYGLLSFFKYAQESLLPQRIKKQY
ncbi:protein TEX261-like [Liolophura sinensis]|uniref:protein TEX261-like n=1 Tax=Liolophura sinensis TaxID=3198878 RepID=UPI0031583AA9